MVENGRSAEYFANVENVEPTLASKMCIVISFNIPADNEEESYKKSRSILQDVKGVLKDRDGLLIYGAVNEVAAAIVKVLNDGIQEQEQDD